MNSFEHPALGDPSDVWIIALKKQTKHTYMYICRVQSLSVQMYTLALSTFGVQNIFYLFKTHFIGGNGVM